MGWFRWGAKKRQNLQAVQNSHNCQPTQQQTFILEPILTPSGLIDGSDDIPDPILVDLDIHPLPEVDLSESDAEVSVITNSDIDSNGTIASDDTAVFVGVSSREVIADSTLEIDIPDEQLEPLDFIDNLDATETVATVETSETPTDLAVEDTTDFHMTGDVVEAVTDASTDSANVSHPDLEPLHFIDSEAAENSSLIAADSTDADITNETADNIGSLTTDADSEEIINASC